MKKSRLSLKELKVTPDQVQLAHHCSWMTYSDQPITKDADKETSQQRLKGLEDYCQYTGRETYKKYPFKNAHGHIGGYIIHTGKEIVIAFHGTTNLAEIKSDLDMRKISPTFGKGKKALSTCEVHSGMYQHYASYKDDMLAVLKQCTQGNALPLTFTGHSLGAAVASYAALDYTLSTRRNKREITVIGEGGPRGFSTTGARIYNKHLGNNTLRIISQRDWIPSMPPKWLSFAHVGWKTVLATDKKFVGAHLQEAHTPGIKALIEDSYIFKQSTSMIEHVKQSKLYEKIASMGSQALQWMIDKATPSHSMMTKQAPDIELVDKHAHVIASFMPPPVNASTTSLASTSTSTAAADIELTSWTRKHHLSPC